MIVDATTVVEAQYQDCRVERGRILAKAKLSRVVRFETAVMTTFSSRKHGYIPTAIGNIKLVIQLLIRESLTSMSFALATDKGW